MPVTGKSSPTSSSKSASAAAASAPPGGQAAWPALVPQGHHAGKPPIPLMRPVTLVGARQNAHLHLLSRQISKAHALIISSDGKVYIRDLASRTHVYVNGQEIRETDLVDGDLLKIGSFVFKFQAAAGMKQKPRPDDTPAGQLEVDGADFPLQVDQRVMLIGRRPSCDISLLEESASTAHAVIFSMNGKRYVRDLGSRTGTHVNAQQVRQQEINFGDVLRIGDTTLRYEASTVASPDSEVLHDGRQLNSRPNLLSEPSLCLPAEEQEGATSRPGSSSQRGLFCDADKTEKAAQSGAPQDFPAVLPACHSPDISKARSWQEPCVMARPLLGKSRLFLGSSAQNYGKLNSNFAELPTYGRATVNREDHACGI